MEHRLALNLGQTFHLLSKVLRFQVCTTVLSTPTLTIIRSGGVCSWMVKYLPSICKTLGLIPSTEGKKKRANN